MEGIPSGDLQTKYQKLASEYSKVSEFEFLFSGAFLFVVVRIHVFIGISLYWWA